MTEERKNQACVPFALSSPSSSFASSSFPILPPSSFLPASVFIPSISTPTGCSRLKGQINNLNSRGSSCDLSHFAIPREPVKVSLSKRRRMKEKPIGGSLASQESINQSGSIIREDSNLGAKTLSNETNSNEPADLASRIFIGNLNTNVITKRSLAVVFSTYGTLKAISLHKGR